MVIITEGSRTGSEFADLIDSQPGAAAPSMPPGAMHIALIGSTSAGKTTYARGVVEACRDRGLEAWLSEDFAARQVGLHWMRDGFVRRRGLELASLLYCLTSWRRYRDYHALAIRLIRDGPGSWAYKTGLLRLTFRKTGIHEILRRRLNDGQIVISDNEAVLQGAHHLFVHPNSSKGLDGVGAFAALAPLPDVVFYLRTSEPVLVERILRRGHRRLGSRSVAAVERTVQDTVELFDRLCSAPSLSGRLLVIEGSNGHSAELSRRGDELPDLAAQVASEGWQAKGRARRSGPPASNGFTLSPDLATELIGRLNRAVGYCHWKSNFFLAQGNDEDGDLDLLVAPQELDRARDVLAGLGFREALVPSGPRAPGVWHYYGCDPSTGSLIHVHLFTRVVTGESFVKSHRLPLDRMLLENSEMLGDVRVPTKAAELVLFTLRTFIKYGSLPDLLRLARGADSVRAEYRWLETQCSVPAALALLETHCPLIDERVFLECLTCLHHDESLSRRILLARRVRRSLRAYATRSSLGRWGAYLWFLAAYARRKLSRTRGAKVWHSGGALIALVGPDATGKSTLARETARWLRSASTVEVVHLGKPRSSLWTWPINSALRAIRAVRGRRARWKPDSLPVAPKSEAKKKRKVGWSAMAYAIRAVVLAFDRRRAVRRAWLSATRGRVVICDRYPTSEVGAMDGPRLHVASEAPGRLFPFYRRLAQIEGRVYGGLPQPDVLIRLNVSLETAKQRNREREKADKHTDDDLSERHQSLGSWSTPKERCWDVSTEGSIEDTLSRLKQAIWEVL